MHAFVSNGLEADMEKLKPSMESTQLKDFNETDTYPVALMILEILGACEYENKMWELVENLLANFLAIPTVFL